MEGLNAIVLWAYVGIAVGILLLLKPLTLAIVGIVQNIVEHHRVMKPQNWYIV